MYTYDIKKKLIKNYTNCLILISQFNVLNLIYLGTYTNVT